MRNWVLDCGDVCLSTYLFRQNINTTIAIEIWVEKYHITHKIWDVCFKILHLLKYSFLRVVLMWFLCDNVLLFLLLSLNCISIRMFWIISEGLRCKHMKVYSWGKKDRPYFFFFFIHKPQNVALLIFMEKMPYTKTEICLIIWLSCFTSFLYFV